MAAPCSIRLLLATALASAVAFAQERLVVEGPVPGTVKLGDTARIALKVEGRGVDPRAPELPKVDGLSFDVSPPSRNSFSYFDGRTLTENFVVQYTVTVRPQREGRFVIPPIRLWTGTRQQQTQELQLDVVKDMRGADLGFLQVQATPQRVYVHEPVRVRVEVGILNGLRIVDDVHNRYRYLDIEVQAPWLSRWEGGEPLEAPQPPGDQRLIVCNRTLQQAGFPGAIERSGRRFDRFVFDKVWLPTRIGKHTLSAPQLRFQALLREGQMDIFGGRRGAQSENYYVYGQPIELEVLPIPEEGRPRPYYGAVGRFRIDAELDRDQVEVGSSVKLTVTIRGEGNLEFLRVPELDQLDGFHKLGQAQARRDGDKVVVTYDLRPLRADITAIPPIAWNYFDTTPGVERFQSVATKALPLLVKPLASGETLLPLPDDKPLPITPGVDDIHDLPAFDGPAIPRPSLRPLWAWLLALGPWAVCLLLVLSFRGLRKRLADTDGRRARGAGRACRQALQQGVDPVGALAEYLGARLGAPAAAVIGPDLRERLLAAGLEPEAATAVTALLERGTAARYGGGAPLDADAVRQLVDQLDGKRFGKVRLLPWIWLPLLLATAAGTAQAQSAAADPELEAAISAYRQGDYAGAEAAFARLVQQRDDRRLWQARGNCLYRLGDLPRALWAYECARLGLVRDPQLLANLALVRQKLELDAEPVGFVAGLGVLRERLTPAELAALCALCMAAAAVCLVLGIRRIGVRWLFVLFVLPGGWFAIELLWWLPSRPPSCVALGRLPIVAEPRDGMEPVATVKPGLVLPILGGDVGNWLLVQAGDRAGYVQKSQVARIE